MVPVHDPILNHTFSPHLQNICSFLAAYKTCRNIHGCIRIGVRFNRSPRRNKPQNRGVKTFGLAEIDITFSQIY